MDITRKKKTLKIHLRLSPNHYNQLSDATHKSDYLNKSEFIRAAINEKIERSHTRSLIHIAEALKPNLKKPEQRTPAKLKCN